MPPDLQSALLALITGRGAGPETMIDSLILGDARASAAERLAVYAHMYRARLVEALEAQFPRLARHLGPDAFSELAAAYVHDEPSTHPSLRFIGERLPPWLAAHRPDSPTRVGLAALEWARADVFDLVDEATLSVDSLRAWPADRFGELPLRLITAHRILRVAPGSAALWDEPSAPLAIAASDGLESVLVWREGTLVYHRVIDDAERSALALAAAGTSFGVVCERLLAQLGEDQAVSRAFAWLSTWVADGLVRAPE
jgi:hypothetical protein